jgi:hypothetical protein
VPGGHYELTDDAMTDWIYVTGGRELTPVTVDGLDVWQHDWTALASDPVTVKDPLYGQDFEFSIYTITDGRRTVTFAAGEFSNGMWGFFQQQSN